MWSQAISTHAHRYGDAVEAYQKASVNARRRGAIHEAFACLTEALEQQAHCAAGTERDRVEIAIRLERGLLGGHDAGEPKR